jgi:hypothetical protein
MRRRQRGGLVVDLGNGSATITTDDGKHGGTWSGVTTRGVRAAIGREGWRIVGSLKLAPARNGFVARVKRGAS